MAIEAEQVEEQLQVKRYKVQYPISAYTFPREARIHQVNGRSMKLTGTEP